MGIEMPNWLSGLGQSGWIAIVLLITFVVIATTTVVMIWRLIRQTSHHQTRTEVEIDEPQPAAKPAPAPSQAPAPAPASKPAKAGAAAASRADEEVDPVAEAEVYITYGLYKQAITVLGKHLAQNPSDNRASEMLEKAMQKSE